MPSSQQRATDRTVLITGASSGIGAAAAEQLAAAGYQVFGTSRHPNSGPSRHGAATETDNVRMLSMDVRDDESVIEAVAHVIGQTGRIDVLVNNAGVLRLAFAEETNRTEADAIFETNLFGAIRVTNAVLPRMRQQRQGRIINVGSLAAWIGEPGESVYAASKAALARYTEALRHEVWHLGIQVSLLEPGVFATNVLHTASTQPTPTTTITDYDGPREAVHQTLHDSLDRGGDPRDVGKLISTIARARRPRARYGSGRDARWLPLAKLALPQRLVDHLLRRTYHLPPRPGVPNRKPR